MADGSKDSARGGESKIYKCACRMCHGGCVALVHVKDGRAVKIEGDPDCPINRGRLCVKGLASLEHLYNPQRLKYPLKRAGARGEGKWERITWDEALDTIANKINEVKEKHGIESVAVGQGTGRPHFYNVIRFINALGTPNWCEPGSAQCFLPRFLTGMMTYGDLPVCDYYGEVNPGCLLVWGHNPVVTGPDGESQFRVRECIKKGARLIVVDPRRTETAKKAELWLQLRPGTDDALALSMMNVIINENLYDKDFVEKWTVGFDGLAERVQEYPPEWAEKVTWVPAAKIREAARLFAQTKPAGLEWGVGLEHSPNSMQTVRAVSLLPGLTGNIDIPGGWMLGMHATRLFPDLSENLTPEAHSKRLGGSEFRMLGGPRTLAPTSHSPTLFRAMRTGEPYPIEAFLIFGNNALLTYANPREVYDSLMKVGFFAVMDIYMTPTAELADIVLPAATWLEGDQIFPLPYVAANVVVAQQKVVSMWEARQTEEVLSELARRLNLESGTEPPQEILDYQLAPLGITFEELKEKGWVTVPLAYRKYEANGFATPSGKVELSASTLANEGYDPLPYYQEPPESPFSQPELAQEYPFILITGGRTQQYFLSEYRQVPSLRQAHPDPLVEINPQTAGQFQIEDGDWVWIESPRGRIKQKARLTEDIDPRVVHVQHGWWFPEETDPEHGVWRSNANLLTSNGPPYDPALGTYQLRALLCKIYKSERPNPDT